MKLKKVPTIAISPVMVGKCIQKNACAVLSVNAPEEDIVKVLMSQEIPGTWLIVDDGFIQYHIYTDEEIESEYALFGGFQGRVVTNDAVYEGVVYIARDLDKKALAYMFLMPETQEEITEFVEELQKMTAKLLEDAFTSYLDGLSGEDAEEIEDLLERKKESGDLTYL